MAYAVGLMSGTSLDGVDAALVEITGQGQGTKVKLLRFVTLSYTDEERRKIEACLSRDFSDVQQICSLNFELGYKFAKAVKMVCHKAKFPLDKLDFIGSHGQTIWHQPVGEQNFLPSTLQIGEPAIIAYETKATVVSNFRTMDMAAGGQGAPLVPFSEWLLYGDSEKSRLLQNIGGIGNVTVVPKNAKLTDIFAFDTGPGNMMIDEACQQLFSQPYDAGGELAAVGKVDEDLLNQLMGISYINQKPPKTTGRELFGKALVSQIIREHGQLSKYDLLATLTFFTAKSIVLNYEKFIFPTQKIDEVIIAGGGSYNLTLLEMIQRLLKNRAKVITQETLGLSSEAKEAVAFAILANETLQGGASNVPKATGARENVVLGNITSAPFSKIKEKL